MILIDVNAVPPVADPLGRVHDIVFVLADVADTETPVGLLGLVVTVTDTDADEGSDVPEALVAVTVKVGVAPAAIPVTVIGEDAPDADWPVLAVTV